MDRASGPDISIVVPVGPGDDAWRELLAQLGPRLRAETEVLLAATTPEPPEFSALKPAALPPAYWRWLVGPPGRAAQQNHGATAAGGRFLWFLHADSRLEPDALVVLWQRLSADPAALWYFDLRFLPDGPRLMWVNTVGTRFRSRLLGLPFGDQGLALSRQTFDRLGGFREDQPYGEDHLLVWAARHAGVRLRPVGCALYTSARKYRQRGWLGTTLTHLWLTWRQALPQGVAWLRRQ
jgi:cellulose synthase/poly-beta-1,6-N-acetylglucosamine synthase-like glycosyltransferase